MTQVYVAVGNAACWGLVVVVWTVSGLHRKTDAPSVRTRSRSGPIIVIAVAALCAAVALLIRPYWHDLTFGATWVRIVGLAILVTSTVFALWSRLTLGTMWSFDAEVRVGHELRTTGPYGVTRHPIYTGLLGMLFGSTLLSGFGHWVVLFPVGLLLCEIKARSEERLLTKTFPEDYPAYRQRVPQLIPGFLAQRRTGS
jgi:protein-S-isoprenylcysteine O-methyltransferase Ste14